MLYDPKWQQTKEGWRNILLEAADAIERYGHAKNALVKEGRMCMGGAINFACFGDPDYWTSNPDRTQAMQRLHDACGDSFTRFNNAPETTQAAVVAKLRETAHS